MYKSLLAPAFSVTLCNHCVLSEKNVKYQSTSLDSVDLAKINPTENENGKNLHKENCFQIKDVDFTDVHNAFQSKTNFDLLRGGIVYQLCKNSFLVDNAMKVCL